METYVIYINDKVHAMNQVLPFPKRVLAPAHH